MEPDREKPAEMQAFFCLGFLWGDRSAQREQHEAVSKSYDSEVSPMKVAAVVSTKGGPGKTTVGANLGAFCADAGVRTLLIDLDNQPSLTSFYNLAHEAPGDTAAPSSERWDGND